MRPTQGGPISIKLIDTHYSSKLKANINDDPQMDFQQHKLFVMAFLNDFPDGQMKIKNILCTKDTVVKHYSFKGTHKGSMLGFPATYKQIQFTGMGIYKVKKKDKEIVISNLSKYHDMYGILRQAGLVP